MGWWHDERQGGVNVKDARVGDSEEGLRAFKAAIRV